MIYIVKHKEYKNPVPSWYKEFGVGQLYKGNGENINHLNRYLNEATAYYDLWKNSNDKTLGVCHYRRFFAENAVILNKTRAEEILKDHDMIVATKYNGGGSLYNLLRADLAPGLEIELLNKYLAKIYMRNPKFHEYMMRNNEFYPREMMITTRPLFNLFCSEFFDTVIPIAEEFREEFMTDKEVATKNPRLIGFIVERFFSYIIEKNEYKTYEMNFIEV